LTNLGGGGPCVFGGIQSCNSLGIDGGVTEAHVILSVSPALQPNIIGNLYNGFSTAEC
jgi:hypothetical protein